MWKDELDMDNHGQSVKSSVDFDTTLEIVKQRQHIAYLQGRIRQVEEMKDILIEHYFKDNKEATYAVYECADSLYSFYDACLDDEEENLQELLERGK